MFKWARELSKMRWRSINTLHEVQMSAKRFPLKTVSPNTVNVAPDALHRASGDTQWLTVPMSDRSPDATSQRPVAPSGGTVRCSGEFYKLPEYGTGRYPVRPVLASRAQDKFTTSLGVGPDAAR